MVPNVFENETPPTSPFDLDADKLNENFNTITDGTALESDSIKSKHVDESTMIITHIIKQFILVSDLVLNPITDLGLDNGDIVAINEAVSQQGDLYIVLLGQWSLLRTRILNQSVVNEDDDLKYRLILNNVLDYVWKIEAVIDDSQNSNYTTWSSDKIIAFLATIRWMDDYLTGNDTAIYTLTYQPLSHGELIHVGGSVQKHGVDYTVSGNTITFSEPIPSGYAIWVHYVYQI